MFTWFLLSAWLVLTVTNFIKQPKPSNLTYGLGWIKFETKALNNLPIRLLEKLGVFCYPSNSARFINPKSFDDDGSWDQSQQSSQAQSNRRPSKFSMIKRAILNTFYDIGSILTILSVFFALVLLLYLLFSLLVTISEYASSFMPSRKIPQASTPTSLFNASYELVRRAAMPAQPNSPNSSSNPETHADEATEISPNTKPMFVQLVIPGLTMPWSTFPVYLTALLISQVFHEAGHAFAAALNSVLVESVGIYIIFPLIPVFYVKTLTGNEKTPKTHMKLNEIKKLRVATAGICHNLVMALFSWLVWNGGYNLFDSTVGRLSWQDVSNNGVLVAHVNEGSPIRTLLNPRDIIVQVDDISLKLKGTSGFYTENASKRWKDCLSKTNDAFQGSTRLRSREWCFAKDKFQMFSSDCCEKVNLQRKEIGATSNICFWETGLQAKATNPHCLLAEGITNLISNERCATNSHCARNKICIQPALGESLTRIQLLKHPTATSRQLIYRGPRELLFQDISVSNLIPRYEFMDANLIIRIHDFFSFLISLSLGLAFINLLPLQSFDGSAICEGIVSFISTPLLLDDSHLDFEEHNLDLTSIGHLRSYTTPTQPHSPQNLIQKELQESILFKFLSLLFLFLIKLFSFLSSDSRPSTTLTLISNLHLLPSSIHPHHHNQLKKISSAIRKSFRILQSITLWISCVVFIGLCILSF